MNRGRSPFALGLALLLLLVGTALAEDETFPLTVRDGETGRPVPAATVHVILPDVLRRETMLPHVAQEDLAARAKEHGLAVVADANGVARLPRALLESGWCVFAEGGRFGATSFYDPDLEEVHELEVFPDASLDLRVLGPDGEPAAGIPLSLRRPAWGGYPFLWRGRSGEGGEAVVPHAPWRLRRYGGQAARVQVELPGVDVGTDVASPRLPDGPVVLRLPETGRLRVVPGGAGGQGRLRLTLREAPLERWAPSVEHDVEGGAERVFPHVGLGRRYRLDAHPFEHLFRDPDPPVVAGPAKAGEEVRVDLVVEAKNVLLAGRVVDEAGEPVPSTEFQAWIRTPHGSGLSGVETDAEGRFSYVLDRYLAEGSAEGAEVALELVPQERSMAGDAKVRIALAPPFAPGVTDLGDVVLPSLPPVLSGVAVDREGRPVPEVYVFVLQGRAPTPEEAGQRSYDPRPVASDEEDEPLEFVWSPRLRAISDAQGRFVMTGELLAGQPCRFAIHKPGWTMCAPQLARPGSAEERVVLEETGRLEGAIRVGPHLSPRWLRLVLRGRPAAGDVLSPGTWKTEAPPPDDVGEVEVMPGWVVLGQVSVPARDGIQPFVFTDLRPGKATLSVSIDSDPDPVAAFEDVAIASGGVSRDPRFASLDVAGLVRFVRVTIGDASGALPGGLEVRVFRGHDRQTARQIDPTIPEGGGTVEVGLAAGLASRLDLEVRAPGRRAVRLDDVQADAVVRLEPGIRVRVRLPAREGRAAEAPRGLTAHPVHDETQRHFRFRSDAVGVTLPAGEVDHAELVLPTPGRWLLVLAGQDGERARTTIDVAGDATETQQFAFE